VEYGENTDQQGQRETHIVGSVVWREKLKNQENEKLTWQDMKYGEKH
jgi:hypothetical protein